MQLPKLKKEKEASLIASRSQDPSGQVRPRKPFSPETFLQVLISFVVADDQVRCAVFSISLLLILFQSINVMECPEFRNLLLLLRPDLADKDIPHRTKLRESIIKAWKTWFESLKKDLSVYFVIIAPEHTY